MNWRTLTVGVFMSACIASWAVLFGGNCDSIVAVLLFLAGIAGTGLWLGISWLYKHSLYKYHNFELAILNHLPFSEYQTDSVVEALSVKILPVKLQKLSIEVRSTRGFQVKTINFRCTKSDKRSGHPIKEPVRVGDVEDPFNRGIWDVGDDGYNGITGEYKSVRGLDKGRCLYYELSLTPTREWSGFISIEVRDSDGFPSYGKHAIQIRDGAQEVIVPADWRAWKTETSVNNATLSCMDGGVCLV